MIERVYRRLARSLPEFADSSIPLQVVVQTALVSVFAVTLRWSSFLMTGLIAAAALGVVRLPVEVLMVLTPMVWSDRTVLSYLRIRRF